VPEERRLVERLREDVGTKFRARMPDRLGHAISALLTPEEKELLVVTLGIVAPGGRMNCTAAALFVWIGEGRRTVCPRNSTNS